MFSRRDAEKLFFFFFFCKKRKKVPYIELYPGVLEIIQVDLVSAGNYFIRLVSVSFIHVQHFKSMDESFSNKDNRF